MAENERLAGPDYVGRKKCGCYTVWISGSVAPARRKRLVAKLERDGYEVLPCRTEWARENVRACHCGEQAAMDFEPVRLQG